MTLDDLPPAWRAKVRVEGACWLWTGWNSGNGYGKVKVSGRAMMAHRAVWELRCEPVPDGMVLDHLCRNRACVNPAHLDPVSVRENTQRGHATLFRPREAYP